jgi:hypothetical protein
MVKYCITCVSEGKKRNASFGDIGGKPMYCSKHKKDNMFCLSRPLLN